MTSAAVASPPQCYFPPGYDEARARFTAAADTAGALRRAYTCPATGPDGRSLYCDTAWLGDPAAEAVLVTISATHGVEGFCGSGVQTGWLESGLWRAVPDGIAQLFIHAINPHGFAWLRRVTEDNVDLNRNFVDFDRPLPANPGYDALAEALCPRRWDEASRAAGAEFLEAYAQAHGQRERQAAIAGGQYGHPDGIFFGGRRPTWSRQVLEMIFSLDLARAKRVGVIDYHTGLGPRGHGERICIHGPDSDAAARARTWYRDDLTSPALGTSSSVELSGANVTGMERALGIAGDSGRELTAIALEYGTQPTREVLLALRADNWLHLHGDPASEQGREIKRQIRDALYPDADDWKQMVFQRAVETQNLAVKGLAGV